MKVPETKENEQGVAPNTAVLLRKATGPRTSSGKERSKHNAWKHGIFGKVVLLSYESRSDFDSLLRKLREDLKPEGTLEEVLVEKLATLIWRYRRLLIAETAEIRKSAELPNNDKYEQDEKVVRFLVRYEGEENHSELMQAISSPQLSEEEECLRLLTELETGIKNSGFDRTRDSAVLAKLYGRSEGRGSSGNLFDRYQTLTSTSECSQEEHQRDASTSRTRCVEAFLTELREEIERVERYRVMVAERTQSVMLHQCVPSHPGSERLVRYEASLERNFDRTLSQLERLQRMRLGQPVLPKLEVQHSVV